MTNVLRIREAKLLEVRKVSGSVVLVFEPPTRYKRPSVEYRADQLLQPPGGFIVTIYDDDVAVLVEDHQVDDPGPPLPAQHRPVRSSAGRLPLPGVGSIKR
jgi:hypothetical protein